MSLNPSKIKDTAGKLSSGKMGGDGLKGKVIAILFGYALGVVANLLLAYIFTNIVYPMTDAKNADGTYRDPLGQHTLYIDGFSIYPWQNVSGHMYMYYNDIILVISTIVLLMTKKWFFILGYFAGWYSTAYFGLYRMLGLPLGPREVAYSTSQA